MLVVFAQAFAGATRENIWGLPLSGRSPIVSSTSACFIGLDGKVAAGGERPWVETGGSSSALLPTTRSGTTEDGPPRSAVSLISAEDEDEVVRVWCSVHEQRRTATSHSRLPLARRANLAGLTWTSYCLPSLRHFLVMRYRIFTAKI
jgi:hypothetical protein